MARRFYGSIDVKKIDKSKLVEGKQGLYLPITVWVNDEEDQFGNKMSIQIQNTKEEREAGAANVYLGNLKEADGKAPAKAAAPSSSSEQDDLPF